MKLPKKQTIASENQGEETKANFQQKIKMISHQEKETSKKKLHWKKEDVQLQFDLPANEMRTANLQIMIWCKNQQNSKKNVDQHYLVGECFHFISKLIHSA